ncbi:SSU ribosomal protein S14P [Salsuginibacillus halophilus]|uniref:Small ribosomal subunit protein uS14 n=1 Tax=Salsuginibacillus halophilus TaxID=517424 RepID=A0A2P8HBQ1_9BACI|nr:30S ribosomal protein S14 [Salsuginibacillus halophilus]PSL43561.1 SSU ribosomal protein S14P [Salsuginibacillus halophilus]
MARKAKVAKEQKRQETVERYAALRQQLKEARDYEALKKLPRDASPTRLTRRCRVTGRPRGVYQKFGMSRIALREFAHKGQVPGLKKSSW